jgi:Tfp pilus assembly protein PilN
MIRINLLPQKRAKLRSTSSDPSSKHIFVGVGALVALGAATFLLADQPLRSELSTLKEQNEELRASIARQKKDLDGYQKLLAAKTDALARSESITRLMQAKIVPAHILHELGEILTKNHDPTMTQEMTRRMAIDPNKRFQLDWDPTHVWLSGFSDTAGVFKLEGGAQSETDVTQLSKRLAASAYFTEVTPAGGERVVDQASGLNYYRFTITGKLVY